MALMTITERLALLEESGRGAEQAKAIVRTQEPEFGKLYDIDKRLVSIETEISQIRKVERHCG